MPPALLRLGPVCSVLLLAPLGALALSSSPPNPRAGSASFSWPLLVREPARQEHAADRVRTPLDNPDAKRLVIPQHAKALVIAPHPDDETLAAAGLIGRVLEQRGSVRVVFATNGDGYAEAVAAQRKGRRLTPEDFRRYGRQRQAEAQEALLSLGIPASWIVFLGYPDGGIDDLWATHWAEGQPFVSPFTRLSQAVDGTEQGPKPAYVGSNLAENLADLIRAWQPTMVVFPDPRDQHLDHCTLGVFVLEAVREIAKDRRASMPQLLGYLVHFPEYPGTPVWPDLARRSGVCGAKDNTGWSHRVPWTYLALESEEVAAKDAALSRYASQLQVMRAFLLQFVRPMEWFSILGREEVATIPLQHAARSHRGAR